MWLLALLLLSSWVTTCQRFYVFGMDHLSLPCKWRMQQLGSFIGHFSLCRTGTACNHFWVDPHGLFMQCVAQSSWQFYSYPTIRPSWRVLQKWGVIGVCQLSKDALTPHKSSSLPPERHFRSQREEGRKWRGTRSKNNSCRLCSQANKSVPPPILFTILRDNPLSPCPS